MTTTAGIVLAGGFARRFGDADKTLATLDDKPLLAHVVDALRPVVDEIVVSCREEQIPAFEDVLDADVTYWPDPTPDEGPLAGLAAALDVVDAPRTVLVTADMPCVPPDLYRELLDALESGDAEAAAIRDGDYLEAAPGVYRTAALRATVAERRSAGDARLRSIFGALSVVEWPAERVRERWGELALVDVNTREKLAAIAGR